MLKDLTSGVKPIKGVDDFTPCTLITAREVETSSPIKVKISQFSPEKSSPGKGRNMEKGQAAQRFQSVSKKYQKHLDHLCEEVLAKNSLHYIRCFNPNAKQELASNMSDKVL